MKKQKNYQILIHAIIEEMQFFIGDVAIVQANLVPGLTVNGKITIAIDPLIVTEKLIERYQYLMGPVALTLSKKAAKKAIKRRKRLIIPEVLK